jgi:hypothetical protein
MLDLLMYLVFVIFVPDFNCNWSFSGQVSQETGGGVSQVP